MAGTFPKPDIGLVRVCYANALRLLAMERRKARRIDHVYRVLSRHYLEAGIVEWLANPFIRTALVILEKFQADYRIKEAIKLLREAGEEASKAPKKKGR